MIILFLSFEHFFFIIFIPFFICSSSYLFIYCSYFSNNLTFFFV